MDKVADGSASKVSMKNLRADEAASMNEGPFSFVDRTARMNEEPFGFADRAARMNEQTDKVADGPDGMDGGSTDNAGKDN